MCFSSVSLSLDQMRLRTGIVLTAVFALLGSAVLYGLTGAAVEQGTLTEEWISDTSRSNVRNHHPIGAMADGTAIVAPVTGVPGVDNMTNTTCSLVRLAHDDGQVRWRVGMPADACFSHALTEPAIGNIDDDASPEAVVATTQETLVAYDVDSGREEFRVPLSSYGYSRPTIENLTAAPGLEIVASDINGGLVVTGHNGTVLWRYTFNENVYSSPIVRDVDGDGTTEVLVSTSERTILFGPTGTIEWQASKSGQDYVVAQADDDAPLEVYLTGTTSIIALDGQTGTQAWQTSVNGAPRVHEAVDGDDDGTPELYLGVSGGRIAALNSATGDIEWQTDLRSKQRSITPAPTVGNVDNDDELEVVAVTNDGTTAVLSVSSGNELAAYDREIPIWTFPTLTDIDADSNAEILVRYGDGRVVALSYAVS